jgi:hypothetical protein
LPVVAKWAEIFFWSSGLMFSHLTIWGRGQEERGLLHFLSWKQKNAQGVDSRPLGNTSSGFIPSLA